MGIYKSFAFTLTLLISTTAWAQEFVPGEVIVKFKKTNSAQSVGFSNKAVGMGISLKKSWDGIGVSHYKTKSSSQDVEQLAQQLRNDPNVEFAEPNYILKMMSTGQVGPKASREEVLSHAQNSRGIASKSSNSASSSSSYIQTDANIKVEETWSILNNSTYVPVVAVIDSGVDYTHEIFVNSGAIWQNAGDSTINGVDDDHNGYIDDVRGWNFRANTNNPMDDNNHGTHVAGIVLGVGQDIFATSMTPAKIRIMPLKFLGSDGSGSTSDAIEAVYYAIDNGATVINASWGGGSYSQALLAAITDAYNAGVSFVAAAGNSHLNNDNSPTYPANYAVQNVVSIAATTDSDAMASFSNYGAQTVHVASPGQDIWSSLPGDSYAQYSGTSMATPIVAGMIALMEIELGGPINGYQARQILLGENDYAVGNVMNKVSSDSRINVYKAVNYVKTNGVEDYQPTARSVASAGGSSGGCGLVKNVMDNAGDSEGGLFGRALLMLIVLTPFAVAMALRMQRKEGVNRRVHDRYNISSEVRINFGEKELVGSVSTISLGGVKIDTDALLENGGIIEMNIMSPDGKEKIQVMGKVVWSAERKSYGVQFADLSQSSTISQWTKKLVKTST